jgi:hypothetical protein
MHSHDEFDRQFDKAWKRTSRLTVVAAVVYLAVVAVAIWAAIRLVLHFT